MKKAIQNFKKFFMLIGLLVFNFTAQHERMNYEDSDYINNLLGVGPVVDEDGTLIDEDVELEELGRIARKTNDRKSISRINRIKRAQRARRRRAHLAASITPAQRMIVGSKNRMKPEVQKDIADGNLTFADRVIYFRKRYASFAGITEIIKSNDTIGIGYSNLYEGGEVPANLTLAAKYIVLNYSQFNTGTQDEFTNAFSRSVSETSPLCHGEFEMYISGKLVLSIPTTSFKENRTDKGHTTEDDQYGYNLERPIVIPAKEKINFMLKLPEGVVATAPTDNNWFLNIELHGEGTISR